MAKPAQRPSQRPLTRQQELFVSEYAKDLNASQAAARAGYAPANAERQGSQLLQNPRVRARIDAGLAARLARVDADADFVLRRLMDEINADAGELFDDAGQLLPVKQWPAAWRRGLVSRISTTTLYDRLQGGERGRTPIGHVTDVVLVDRARRLELLGKHIKVGAFQERVQLGADTPLQELFRQISGNVIRPRTIEHEPGAGAGADRLQLGHVPDDGDATD